MSAPLRLVLALAICGAPALAHADDGNDRVAFGGDAIVVAGESVQSVASFGGDAIVDGRVEGDVVSFGGDVALGPSAQVIGSVATFGGRVDAAPGAQWQHDPDGIAAPDRSTPGAHHERHGGLGAWIEEAFRQLVAHGLLFLLGLVLMGLAPERLGAMQIAIVRDPIRTASTGLAGYVGGAILMVLLAITILGIPAAVLLAMLLPIATYVGLAASANVLGACLPIAALRDAPVRRLAAGVLVLFVASLVPVLGTLLVVVMSCLGLGALIRTRFRTTPPIELASRGDVIDCGPYRTSAI